MNRRPIPENFAELVAQYSDRQLVRLLKVGSGTLLRWHKATGVPSDPNLYGRPGITARPIPDDFLERLAEMGSKELAAHYGASLGSVARWRRANGKSGRPDRVAKAERAAAPKPPRPISVNRSAVAMSPKDRAYRENSQAGQAAAYLQPDYIPTFRCREDGTQDVAGRFWRCGRRILTDAAIIELADSVRERRGRRMAA